MIERLLQRYVEELKIKQPEVEDAFCRVLRHQFLRGWYEREREGDPKWRPFHPQHPDPRALRKIYSDTGLLIRVKPFPSSSPQPSLIARKLEVLDLKKGMNVLEIGTGSGYSAALIAEIVADQGLVTSLDFQPDLIQEQRAVLAEAGYGGIRLLAGDGFYGCREHAPYDRIEIDIACPDISPHWLDQLAPDGFILVPLQHGGRTVIYAPLTKVWRADGKILGRVVGMSVYGSMIQGELNAELWPKPPEELIGEAEREGEEYPLFPELAKARRKEDWLSYDSFLYFLVLADSHAFYSGWQRFGLWDKAKGVILIQYKQGKIRLQGDKELYHKLRGIYEQWEALGKPKASDYQIEFAPIVAAGGRTGLRGREVLRPWGWA